MGDSLLYGRGRVEGITAVECSQSSGRVTLFVRNGRTTSRMEDSFEPWFLISDRDMLPGIAGRKSVKKLRGDGFRFIVRFDDFRNLRRAAWEAKEGGVGKSVHKLPTAETQYLTISGNTLFKGLQMSDLEMLAVDIEVYVPEGYEFPNVKRVSDRIILVSFADNRGWSAVLGAPDMKEKELLQRTVDLIVARDPDLLLGHNTFGFDLPWLAERCRRCRVKFGIGRDGRGPRTYRSRYKVGEATKPFTNAHVHGRTVIDTMHLAQRWDAPKRALPSYGLKDIISHLGLTKEERTLIDGSEISRVWETDPEKVIRYARDDAQDVIALASLLLGPEFYQAQMLPNYFQRSMTMGPAGKIGLLMEREYLARGRAIPFPDPKQEYEGAYIDLFWEGVLPGKESGGNGIAKLDFDSLYPSIVLSRRLSPDKDTEGVFLELLRTLTRQRLEAKAKAKELKQTGNTREHARYDAIQSAYKILVNGAYGYLGYPYGNWNDYSKAAEVTRVGREMAAKLVSAIEKRGGIPVEVDTDGVLFVAPRG